MEWVTKDLENCGIQIQIETVNRPRMPPVKTVPDAELKSF